jgi:hypothetical protein
MPEDLDLDAAMAAAEQAAGSGDFVAAERHLRDAARLQEEALGPAHPDLANTLNNLGVVYERNGRTDEAEASYRRAYTIARETLAPDHPFVATSAENLREFCETNGRPFDAAREAADSPLDLKAQGATEQDDRRVTPASPAVEEQAFRPDRTDTPRAAGAADSVDLKSQASLEKQDRRVMPAPPAVEEQAFTPARTSADSARTAADAARARVATSPAVNERTRSARWRVLLLVVSIAAVVVLWMFARSQSRTPATPADPAATNGETSAPAPATSPSATAPSSAPPVSAPSSPSSAPAAAVPDAPRPSSSASPAVTAPPAAAPARAASSAPPVPAPFPTAARQDAPATGVVTLVRADVCDSFSTRASSGADWRCDAIGGTASPGVLVFYTRIRSPRATTVEHRWYRDDALVQNVRLRIGANPGAGYRTYSRNTVGAGAWRVELRASDGTVLHEARFTVR